MPQAVREGHRVTALVTSEAEPGARSWKNRGFITLTDRTIATILNPVGNLPDPQCEVFIAEASGLHEPRRLRAGAFTVARVWLPVGVWYSELQVNRFPGGSWWTD